MCLHIKITKYKRRTIRDLYKLKQQQKQQPIPTVWQCVDAIGMGQFDRILADVPCSGDGTVRKFPHIWRLFRPRNALDLHNIQLQIAKSSILMSL